MFYARVELTTASLDSAALVEFNMELLCLGLS